LGILSKKEALFLVKGISRQVIVVKSPEPKLFDQAIFIRRDDIPKEGITDEMLLKEAKFAATGWRQRFPLTGPLWACGRAACTGLLWLLTTLV
jgi:hypothetical protein